MISCPHKKQGQNYSWCILCGFSNPLDLCKCVMPKWQGLYRNFSCCLILRRCSELIKFAVLAEETYIKLWTLVWSFTQCFNMSISVPSPLKNLSSPHMKKELRNKVWICSYVWDPDRLIQKTWWRWELKLQMQLGRDKALHVICKRVLATAIYRYYIYFIHIF